MLDNAVLIHGDSRYAIPDRTFELVFTSPPYNVGIEYADHEDQMSPEEWRWMMSKVLSEAWRRLRVGGRMVVNTIPLAGRKPPFLIGNKIAEILDDLPRSYWMGQVVWDKAESTGSSTAWGTWRSPRAPVFRGEYEVLYVVAKGTPVRDDLGTENFITNPMSAHEFNLATREVWRDITTASRWENDYPHPVPFPPKLANRVIRLLTDEGDAVLDPFMGRGTTVMVAESLGRHGVGIDVSLEYVETASRLLTDNLVEHRITHFDCVCMDKGLIGLYPPREELV